MLKEEKYRLNCKDVDSGITVIYDSDVAEKALIVYIHGGGLLFGSRNDLPLKHRRAFTAAGYKLVCIDYPLAPENRIETILQSVIEQINAVFSKESADKPSFLFGRSAGAYLALLASCRGNLLHTPAGVISYYGYGFLVDGWADVPSEYYNGFAKVDASCLDTVNSENFANGYARYVYSRQSGCWRDLISGGEKEEKCDTLRSYARLPCPLFCAHSMNDPDVPFSEFLALCARFNPERFITSSEMHDFDRNENDRCVDRLLKATLSFCEKAIQRR